MSSQTFTNGVTLTDAAWFNEVDALVHDVFNAKSTAGTSGTLLRSNGTNIVNTSGLTSDGSTLVCTALTASGNVALGDAVGDEHTCTGRITVTDDSNNGIISARSSGGDALRLGGETAGNGASIGALNSALNDFEPLNMTGEHIAFFRRTGVLTASEAARIDGSGNFLVGKSAIDNATAGLEVRTVGTVFATVNGAHSGVFNRLTDDGAIVFFQQGTVDEGSISVSGTTISYNAFLGSHWSQFQDGSKPDVLKGTVIETIDEFCEWPNEENDRLPKCKISDTVESSAVYGVFLDWDHDDTRTNDLYVAALGAGWVRVQVGQTIARGDLLVSAGDGTAKVQSDDIVRSKTIGKVEAALIVETYPDGSFLVPCTLMCG